MIDDQRFTPTFEPVLGQAIGHEFHMRLPFGGDADSQSLVAPFGVWMRLVLFAGLLVNPATGGDYTVNAALTSVDPDSDGADDGAGAAPLNLALAFPVTIEDPQQIALARFVIDEATVELNSRTHDRFMVKGRYALGSASDGLDPA